MSDLVTDLIRASVYSIPNANVLSAFTKAMAVLPRYERIVVSISGGSDSDIVLDMIERVRRLCPVEGYEIHYVFFDTGLEYQATKDHLEYLEKRYGIEIHRERPEMPIPAAVKKYGWPFLSKDISEKIETLLLHEFDFAGNVKGDCKWALSWWNNARQGQRYNIDNYPYLKDFLMKYPPEEKIAAKCCHYAKKKLAEECYVKYRAQLSVIGVRKSEGGVRSTAYKNCYTQRDDKIDQFRPVFWLTDQDKRDYEDYFGIVHSRCYTEYGLKRTGCVGCPFGRNVLDELAIIKKYEPKLYKACMSVFGKSYEYTRQYREFREEMKRKAKEDPDQLKMEGI